MFHMPVARGDGGSSRRETGHSGGWNGIASAAAWTPARFPPSPSRSATADRSVMLAKLSEILSDRRPERKVSAMFVDSALGAAYVERLRAMGFDNVYEINFRGTVSGPTSGPRVAVLHPLSRLLGISARRIRRYKAATRTTSDDVTERLHF
jgi:hypothetical protein